MEDKDEIWPPAPFGLSPDGSEPPQTLSPVIALPLGFLVGSVCQVLVCWLIYEVVFPPFQVGLTLNSWLSTGAAGTALLSVPLCAGVRRRWRVFGTGFSVAMAAMFCVVPWLLWTVSHQSRSIP